MPGRGFSCRPVSVYPGHHSLPWSDLLLLVVLTSVRGMGQTELNILLRFYPYFALVSCPLELGDLPENRLQRLEAEVTLS